MQLWLRRVKSRAVHGAIIAGVLLGLMMALMVEILLRVHGGTYEASE